MDNPKTIIAISALLLATAIAAGAFGAHALENILSTDRLKTWQTAVQYHAWNALGLMMIGLIGAHFELVITWPSSLILAGIIVFSGSLYTLCLTGLGWLGAITPIGGIAFIAGWIFFALQLFKHQP